MNVALHMRRAGLAHGNWPALARGTAVVATYSQLALEVSSIAHGLVVDLGLKSGDRVALAMKNAPEFLTLLYACWHAGLVAVPTNAKLHRDEFTFILENSGARACFTSSSLTQTISEAAPHALSHIIEVGSSRYAALGAHGPMDLVSRMPDDAAWLFYTSGTTGRPKGATLTHRNLLACTIGYFADVDPGGPWRAFMHAAPMSHGSGLYALANVAQAACHVIPESAGFEPAEVYDLIDSWPGLSFFAAPTMVKRLLDAPEDRDTRNLKVIIYGGGPMYVEDCLTALDRFGPKLSQLYGQGESPMCITALGPAVHADSSHPRYMERLASVGIAQTPVEVDVVDEQMRSVAVGETGEIVVRGDAVMAGYWDNPSATQDSLVDGWLRTGDVGVLDEEGFLTLKDRSKDMIISGGTNIYPREVEEILLRHAHVAEVCVIGRPDREWGESVVAYVVGNGDEATLRSELDALCIESMARFKRPKDYQFIDALPKNNYGKVLKTVVRTEDLKLSNR
jgi:long-chain acyl-CoA synthetase